MPYNLFENHDSCLSLAKANQAKIYGKNEPVRSTGFTKSEETVFNDMIQKGEIADTLGAGYGPGAKAITFEKTGKEIKEKSAGILAALSGQKATVEAQLTVLKVSIGDTIVPSNSCSRRYSKDCAYMRYDWKFCEPKYLGDNEYEEKTPTMDLCNKYNSLIYVYNDLMDDIDAINIISANADDKAKYSLSVGQLIALNFN